MNKIAQRKSNIFTDQNGIFRQFLDQFLSGWPITNVQQSLTQVPLLIGGIFVLEIILLMDGWVSVVYELLLFFFSWIIFRSNKCIKWRTHQICCSFHVTFSLVFVVGCWLCSLNASNFNFLIFFCNTLSTMLVLFLFFFFFLDSSGKCVAYRN